MVSGLTDTHCHIHFPDYPVETKTVLEAAKKAHVTRMICVGCTLLDSKLAVDMAKRHKNIWASIGLHPHEAEKYIGDFQALQVFNDLAKSKRVIAIGEAGLDYYYLHSKKEDQKKLLRFQLDIASEYKLPLIFHVRDAFDDFFGIIDEYPKITGVVHSFSAGVSELEQVLKRGLHVGLNGIMTFTTSEDQLAAARAVPLDRLVLETDAPFLTPKPYRGTICEPKHVLVTAEFLADIRGESFNDLARVTTNNAVKLFGLIS